MDYKIKITRIEYLTNDILIKNQDIDRWSKVAIDIISGFSLDVLLQEYVGKSITRHNSLLTPSEKYELHIIKQNTTDFFKVKIFINDKVAVILHGILRKKRRHNLKKS